MLAVELVLLGASFYLLWNIGANSSANALGTVVGSGILNFRQAVFVTSLFSFLGAYLRGETVMKTVGNKLVSGLPVEALIIVLLSSGLVITLATVKGLPLPATQGIVGSLLGAGLAFGASIHWKIFYLIVLAWIASPFISMVFSIFLYKYYSIFVRRIKSIKRLEILYKLMAIISGSYIAFTLGTNDIANAVAPPCGGRNINSPGGIIFWCVMPFSGGLHL
ncbi:MAG: inorganic phosphate transporter, PiT family [Pyrococcus sp.]|uniref:inorganic phosphate transporter n=1 Tax=Pyrococcus sp. TaxID=33866 RepID=UPI00338E1933|nr:inorganic phosphate transporter, PiT family [Pyrococcus sp.]